jgi:hypothetical protein
MSSVSAAHAPFLSATPPMRLAAAVAVGVLAVAGAARAAPAPAPLTARLLQAGELPGG